MTPFEISILIHYQVRVGDYRDGDFAAPLLLPTLNRFVEAGLLRRTDGLSQEYASTEATAVYVEALCNVPGPVQRWVVPWRAP